MVWLTKAWMMNGFVTARNVCVNMAHNSASPGVGLDMLVELRWNSSEVWLIKITTTVHTPLNSCNAFFEFASGRMETSATKTSVNSWADTMLGIFTSKAQHLGNSVYQLWTPFILPEQCILLAWNMVHSSHAIAWSSILWWSQVSVKTQAE